MDFCLSIACSKPAIPSPKKASPREFSNHNLNLRLAKSSDSAMRTRPGVHPSQLALQPLKKLAATSVLQDAIVEITSREDSGRVRALRHGPLPQVGEPVDGSGNDNRSW